MIELVTGRKKVLVVAPHGVMGNDDHTAPMASELAKGFDFYGIVNEKYLKPKKGLDPDPKKLRVDLNRIDQIEKHLEKEFLKPLLEFKNRIIKEHGRLILVYIHGVKDENIIRAAGEKERGQNPGSGYFDRVRPVQRLALLFRRARTGGQVHRLSEK